LRYAAHPGDDRVVPASIESTLEPPVIAARPTDAVRMRYIDTLRGVAALLVVWLHASGNFALVNPNATRSWLSTIPATFDVGHVGVVVFFLISGFVIPFSIDARSQAPVRSFLVKRFFRLFPAYWLSVPLAAAATFWIWKTSFPARELVLNFAMLQDVFDARRAEGVYWTLPVEIVFYLIVVGLLLSRDLFVPRRVAAMSAALGLAFAIALPLYRPGIRMPSENATFWLLNLSIMLWGTVYRSYVDRDPALSQRAGTIIVWGLGAFYAVALPLLALASNAYMRVTLPTYLAGFAIFIVGARWLRVETRATDWLGRISYSMYLFHLVVFLTIEWWLLKQQAGSAWRTQALGVYVAIGTAIVLVVATLVYYAIEKPGIRIGHRLASRIGRER
jgi:peptidoglycan/LPS O-acetylase OafA/YrhL